MSVADTATEFAPPNVRRQRTDRMQLVPHQNTASVIEEIKPLTEDIAKDALRTATLYGNTVKERNDYAARLNEAMASNRQFEIKVEEQRTEIERLTLERDGERSERIRLASCMEQIIHTAQRSIEQPGANEQD